MRLILNQVDGLGHYFLNMTQQIFELILLLYLSIRTIFINRVVNFRSIFSVVATQIYFTGFQALPLITVLAFFTGAVFVFQALTNIVLLGGTGILGSFLVASIIREASPLLVALVVVARSGTAVASELGNMKANREIDALVMMGINPYSFVVLPRLLGGIFSVLGLSVYFNFVAISGGFVLAKVTKGISFQFLLNSLLDAVSKTDILVFISKNLVCGSLVFLICCYQGLKVQRSPHEVPQRTTMAVVQSILYVTIINFFITALYYLSRLAGPSL